MHIYTALCVFVLAFGLITTRVTARESADAGVFVDGSIWETIGENYNVVEGIAAAKDGTVYVTDVIDDQLIKLVPGGQELVIDQKTSRANGLAFGPNGNLYSVCMAEPSVLTWNLDSGKRSRIPLPSPANDLVISATGLLYCTWGATNAVYQLDLADPKPRKVADVPNPNGITLSPDGGELWVGEFSGDTVRAFPILTGGSLGPSRAAFKAKVPADGKGLLDGMTPLPDGRLLVATALGLQILSSKAEALVLPNPTTQRANYVRIVTDAASRRWIYAAHVKSMIRRRTLL